MNEKNHGGTNARGNKAVRNYVLNLIQKEDFSYRQIEEIFDGRYDIAYNENKL